MKRHTNSRARRRGLGLLTLLLAVIAPSVFPPNDTAARQPQRTRPRTVSQPAPAQTPAPQKSTAGGGAEQQDVDEDEVVRVESLEVLLPATVRDASGALVKTLDRSDFRVFEDGREQPLSDLALRRVPADVALLLDASSSTAESFEDFRRAALDFAALLGEEDRVCLLKFDDRVELLQDWTRSRTQLRRSLGRISAGMFTRFNDALYLTAREQMKPSPSRRRALVILSDGIDSGRGQTSAAALKALLESQSAVYVISNTEIARRRKKAELDSLLTGDPSAVSFNSVRIDGLREGLRVLDASEQSLAVLCSTTGGRLYRPESFDALGDLYRGIAEELRHQYALYYRPLNTARDGSFRRVKVEVKEPGMQVSARVGYYAPK